MILDIGWQGQKARKSRIYYGIDELRDRAILLVQSIPTLGELFFAMLGLSDCHRVDLATT
jgi:hypothetical protein